MAFTQGFISDLVGRRATVNDLTIGKVADFLITSPDDAFPPIDGLVIKTARGLRFAPMDTVADVNRNGTVALTVTPDQAAPSDDERLYLVADLLDKQIVNVNGRKVVRINDIEVADTGGRLRVLAADVGVGGLLRRLGMRSLGRGHHAVVRGVPMLSGAPVIAHDIRAGAALVLGGLAAKGPPRWPSPSTSIADIRCSPKRWLPSVPMCSAIQSSPSY